MICAPLIAIYPVLSFDVITLRIKNYIPFCHCVSMLTCFKFSLEGAACITLISFLNKR